MIRTDQDLVTVLIAREESEEALSRDEPIQSAKLIVKVILMFWVEKSQTLPKPWAQEVIRDVLKEEEMVVRPKEMVA